MSRHRSAYEVLEPYATEYPLLVILGDAIGSGSVGFLVGFLGYGSGTIAWGFVLGIAFTAIGAAVGVATVARARRTRSRPQSFGSISPPTLTKAGISPPIPHRFKVSRPALLVATAVLFMAAIGAETAGLRSLAAALAILTGLGFGLSKFRNIF